MKTTAKIFTLILALVMVLGVFSSCENKKGLTASDYLEKMLESGADTTVGYQNCLEEIIIDPSVFLGGDLGLDKVSLKLFTNNSGEAVFSANAGVNGEKTDINLYYSGNSVVISTSMLENAYGMSLDQLEGLMSAMGGGAMGDEYEGTALNGASLLIDTVMSDYAEQIGKLLAKYIEIIANAADSAAEQKVELGTNTITVSVKFNSDSAKKLIKDVYNTIKKDKDVKKLVENVAKTVFPDEYQTIIASFNAILESDDMLDQLFAVMNQHDFEIGFTVTSDKNYQIKGFGVSGEYNGSKVSFGIDATNENDIVIKTSADVDGNEVNARVNIRTTTSDSDKNVSASLTVEMGGSEMTAGIFNIDLKGDGELKASISSDMMYLFGGTVLDEEDIGENLVEITGTFKQEGKTSVLTIADVTNIVGETVTLNVTVKTTYDVELPAFPTSYKLISELDEEDLSEISDNVMTDPVVSFVLVMIENMNSEDYDEFDEFDEF